MSKDSLKIQAPLIRALRMNKVRAKNLLSDGRLFRHWIKQAVFIRRVGHQAIPSGLDAWTQETTRERCVRHRIYGRLEAVPKGELAIRWLNH